MELPDGPRVIAGRYELQSLIGEGGMASVWRAKDNTLERPVAVKLLYARDERDRQKLVQQFIREARIAASVQHRNVIHIVDFGTTDQEIPFMVMELLEGEPLGRRMHREPKLTVSEIVQISSLTLRGLAAVHSAGIVHRDLKPDNVFLARDAGGVMFPKILDFGISRSVEPRSGRRSALTTQDGIIVGTPEYMSPEQARGLRNIDHRTDLYSMGVILYEALTGRLPFHNEHVGDLIIQIVTATAPPVHELAPSVPRSISDVVAKAMSRERDARYPDAATMQQALISAAQALPNAPRRTLSDVPPPIGEPITATVPRASMNRLRTLEFSLDTHDTEDGLLPGDLSAQDDDDGDLDLGAPTFPRPGKAPSSPLAPVGSPVTPASTELGTAETIQWPPQAKSRAWLKPAAIAAVVGMTLVGVWVASQSGSATNVEPVAVPLPEEPAPAAAPSTIHVALRNVPLDAQIEVDGVAMQGPVLELPRDDRTRALRVTLDGHAPWEGTHVASADGTYDVVLPELAAAVAPAEAPSTAPRSTGTATPARAPRPRSATPGTRTGSTGPSRTTTPDKPPSALRKLDF